MEKLQLSEEEARFCIQKYAGIVRRNLNRIGLFRSDPAYDDFHQIGLIKLLEAYSTTRLAPMEGEQEYAFLHYASQKIYWAFIDEIRRNQKHQEREEAFGEEDMISLAPTLSFEADLLTADLYQKLCRRLTPEERAFLELKLFQDLSISEIARLLHVSRKTVYHWRSRIQGKLQELLD